jgi:4-hydroxybenzoyl-CoA reductase subunit beta
MALHRIRDTNGIRLMEALPEFALVRARTLDDVIRARANHPASSLLGGGTDLVVNIRRGIVAPPVLIDVNHVEELRAIRADARSLEIGAAVKLAELAAHPDVTRHYPVVAQAAAFIAGPTHRNMGTVGGNLCLDTRCLFYNQSEWWRAANHHCLKTTGEICHVAPKSRGVCFATFSGDLAPALLTLGAEVDLAGPAGPRTIALERLYIGYARQDQPITESEGDGKYYLSLRPGEFVTAVRAKNTPGLRSAYDKIRIRRSIDGGGGGAAARARRPRRPARGVHRHQSAAGAAQGHGGAHRRRARRARVQGARRAGARPDHVDEDDVHARPLPPPRRRRAGAAAGGNAVRAVTGRGISLRSSPRSP